MTDWYYYTENREKIGPIEGKVLKQLARQSIITPETFIEDPTGRTGLAKDVKGLIFLETALPEPTLSVKSNLFITPVPQTVPIPPVVAQPPSFAANSSGRILASGNGEWNSAIFLYWVAAIISAVASFAILAYYADDLGSQVTNAQGALFVDQTKLARAEQIVTILGGAAIVVPILILVFGVIYHGSIVNTHIQVDENGIVGEGVGKGFIWGDPRLFGFRLAYNQITSVDVAGNNIIVHASGTQYKCYVVNPVEIQTIIVNLQQGRYTEQQLQELAELESERAQQPEQERLAEQECRTERAQ